MLSSSQSTDTRIKAIFLIALLASVLFTVPLSSGTRQQEIFRSGSQQNEPQINNIASLISRSQEVPAPKGYYLFLSNPSNAKVSAADSEQISQTNIQTPQLKSFLNEPSSGEEIMIIQQQGQNGPLYIIIQQQPQQPNIESNQLSPLALTFSPLLGVWLDSERRRSRFRIYVEILELIKERPMTPYEVAFQLRLNRKKAKEHLDFLVSRGFLELISNDEDKALFGITPNGRTFVGNLRTVLEQDYSFR